MAFTISLNSGYVFTDDEPLTVAKLNQMFSDGYGQVDSGTVDTANISDGAVTLPKMADISRGSIIVGGTANAPTAYSCKTDGYMLIGDGTDVLSVPISGDLTVTNTGAMTIADDAVTLAKLASLGRGSIVVGGEADAPTALVAETDAQILIGDGTDLASVAVTGDIAIDSDGVTSLAADSVGSANIEDAVLQYAEVNVSAAQILSMDAVPVEIVTAPGAGKAILVDSLTTVFDYGGTAFTGSFTVYAYYTNNAGTKINQDEMATMIKGTADAVTQQRLVIATIAVAENAPVVLDTNAAIGGGGTGVMRVHIWYRIIETGL